MAIIIRRKAVREASSGEIAATEELVPEISEPMTLTDVIDRLSKDSGLADPRRRDLISACNSVARIVGRPADAIPAEVARLRDLLSKVHPVQARISRKRLSNIRSDLAAALERVGVIPPTPKVALSSAWRAFLAKATRKHHGWFTSRFARYCSHRQIEPSEVTDTVLRTFREWLDGRVLTNDPGKIVKDTAVAFNAIIKRAGLDIPLLTTATAERHVSRPLEIYPASLSQDIERYLKRLREPDLFSGDGPRRPLRPTSLRNIKAHIRQLLDAAVSSGYPPEHFNSLADLVDIDVINAATTHMIERRGGSIPSGLGNILATVMAIARYYLVLDEAVLKRIAGAQRRVADELGLARSSMSVKSQRRMDQFEVRENVVLLADFPMALLKRAEQGPGKSAAIDAMIAAASAILLCATMRIKDVAGLHMTQDMTVVKEGRNTVILVHVSPDKTKGRQAVDAVIEPPYSTVIARYINHYRPRLSPQPSDWLFPNGSGGSRAPDHFGDLIKKRILRETGLTVNVHLFRHFGAYIYLEHHPGAYEDVRRIVGHAKMDTTTSFYAPASSKSAYRRYGHILRGLTTRKSRK